MENLEKEKLYNVISMTQLNCENFIKRLESRFHFSNFVVIYYSISLIVYSLTAKYFSELYNCKLSEYFCIILSVVILVYSISNSNANYEERIRNMEKSLNSIKKLKREISDNNIERINEEYHNIINISEYTTDIDFFKSLKQKCREGDIRWYNYKEDTRIGIDVAIGPYELTQLGKYLGKVNPFMQEVKILLNYALDVIIILMPVIIFYICFK